MTARLGRSARRRGTVTKHISADLMNARDHSNRRLSAAGSSGAIDLTMLCAWQWKNAAMQPRRSSTCERSHLAQLWARTNFDGEIVDDKGRGRSTSGKLLAPGPFCAVAAGRSPGDGAVDTTGVSGAPARRDHRGGGVSVPTRARLAAGQFSREEDRTEAAKRQRSEGNPCLLTVLQWGLDPTQETATPLGGFSSV